MCHVLDEKKRYQCQWKLLEKHLGLGLRIKFKGQSLQLLGENISLPEKLTCFSHRWRWWWWCFLTGKLSPLWTNYTYSDWRGVPYRNFKTFEFKMLWRSLSWRKLRIGCCTMTTCQFTQNSWCAITYLVKDEPTILSYQFYSPDLVSADFFLFLKLKTIFKECWFQTIYKTEEWYDSYAPFPKMYSRKCYKTGRSVGRDALSAKGTSLTTID